MFSNSLWVSADFLTEVLGRLFLLLDFSLRSVIDFIFLPEKLLSLSFSFARGWHCSVRLISETEFKFLEEQLFRALA